MILLEAAGSKPEIFTKTCLACFSCSVTAWQKLRPMEKKVSSLGASYAVTSSAGCKDWKWMPCPTQQSWEAPDPSHPSPTPILPSAAHAAKDSRPTLAFLNMSSTDTLMWSICTLMWSICDAWNLKVTKREADKKKKEWKALKKLENPPAVEPSPLSGPITQWLGGGGGPNPSVKTWWGDCAWQGPSSAEGKGLQILPEAHSIQKERWPGHCCWKWDWGCTGRVGSL